MVMAKTIRKQGDRIWLQKKKNGTVSLDQARTSTGITGSISLVSCSKSNGIWTRVTNNLNVIRKNVKRIKNNFNKIFGKKPKVAEHEHANKVHAKTRKEINAK